jgi:membrane protease subunit (stomatin/prohibitin family)
MADMGDIVPFTDNYDDLSNTQGYQFEFHCERCGNGYRSPFVADVKEKGRGVLRAAGSMFGGKLSGLSNAAESLNWNRGTNSKAKDEALRNAVEAVKDQFKQCRGCGNWVCVDVCWNPEIGQCVVCSPFVAEEISRAQAAAQVEQIREKVREKDWTADLDLTSRAKVQCPSCHATVEGGKFCPECGEKLAKATFCAECGAEQKEGAKFCAECGTKL